MSLRFVVGDDNGFLKTLRCSVNPDPDNLPTPVTLDDKRTESKARAVQRLAYKDGTLAVARANRAVSVHTLTDDDELQLVREWTEPRMRPQDKYIGLELNDRGVYTTTTSGHLRLTILPSEGEASASSTSKTHKGMLPMRLCDVRLSPDSSHIAYGGDEVDLSLWDVERALGLSSIAEESTNNQEQADGGNAKKRKKPSSNELLPAELWRAKNLPNDSLSLRHPVHVSSLTFLSPPSLSGTNDKSLSSPSHNIMTGSRYGSLRRYDTRAARRPVSVWEAKEWKNGIGRVENSTNNEHEVIVADKQTNLFEVDTRTGKILKGVKGLSGAVTSIAVPPSTTISSSPRKFVASTSLDRFFRLSVPGSSGSSALKAPGKVEPSIKVYLKSTPTAIVYGGSFAAPLTTGRDDEDEEGNGEDRDRDDEDKEGGEEEIWEGMEVVGSDEGEDSEDDESSEEDEVREIKAKGKSANKKRRRA